jgi:Plasmid pRiA4b ORF-3-like protein
LAISGTADGFQKAPASILAKIWRLIAMPADKTLDDLVDVILRSVKFDNDHLHAFSYRNRLGATVLVNHPAMNAPPCTDQVRLGTLPLEPGQTMELTYDFGDEWPFTVKLERIEPPEAKRKAPRILESQGKAPKQYQRWDD